MEQNSKDILIIDIFNIVPNDDTERWEFTPKIDGYTSYAVSYDECSSKEDAIIAVWKSINNQQKHAHGNI